MDRIEVLWVDDEIEMLKPHFLFLEERGYNVTACSNGQDALDLIDDKTYEIILLDENMPGLNGLETLEQIKSKMTFLPVIMITKNEEESIMDEAIGAKISDYLIKPVNPNQILLSLKKVLDHKNLIDKKTIQNYQKEFGKLSTSLNSLVSHQDWINHFEKLIYWELELENLDDQNMLGIFEAQKKEANALFAKFIQENYPNWINSSEGPLLSHRLFKESVLPEIKQHQPTILLVIDNLRFDQWKTIRNEFLNFYKVEKESVSGDKHQEITFPVLAPDPATNSEVFFLKYPIYVGANRGRGQVNPTGDKTNNNAIISTVAGQVSDISTLDKGITAVTIKTAAGADVIYNVPKGLELAVSKGNYVKVDTLISKDPNVGGFGQSETEITLQSPARIYGYMLVTLFIILTQIFLVIKKQVEPSL